MKRGRGRGRWFSLTFMLGLVLLPAQAATYYVATNGEDHAAGTAPETALRSVQEAANRAHAGDTIRVREGTYREYVVFPRSGAAGQVIELAAYPGESPVLKGSEVVTNWIHHTNYIWMLPYWPVASQQVFDNGRPLTQLGWPSEYFSLYPHRYGGLGERGLADMAPNTFFYDSTNLVLYVWLADNAAPTNRTMEVATRLGTLNARTMFGGTNAWYRVRGLSFRHSNTCAFSPWGWPGVWMPDHSVMEECVVDWNDSAAVSLGAESALTNCVLANNGLTGGAAGAGFAFVSCSVVSNNYRNFSPLWAAAGLKFIPDLDGLIQGCEVGWNNGPGLWFDTCRSGQPIVVRSNYIHHNSQNALFIEISQNARVHHNLFVGNTLRSLYVSSSENVHIYNNTIVGHLGWMTVEMFFARARTNELGQPFPLRNNRFANNIIYGSQGVRELVLWGEDPPYCVNNVCDHNCFYNTSGATMALNRSVGGSSTYASLADWAAGTGWDTHSLARDPLFLDGSGGDFHLRSQAGTFSNGVWIACAESSPCIDTGDPRDPFSVEPAWNGGRINIGRYGNTTEAARSLDSDGDGASDTLEQHGLGSNRNQPDSDGDAASDYEEYVAGTDPLSEESVLRLHVTRPQPPSSDPLALSWFGQSERRYHLQYSSPLASENWLIDTQATTAAGEPVGETVGTNGFIEVYLPDPWRVLPRFYRLQVRWP